MNIKWFCRFVSAVFCAVALCTPANAKLATVGAVHDYVREKWEIDIPYRDGTAGQLLNMKYLMELVDVVNEKLNEVPSSNYAKDSKYATSAIVSTVMGKAAADTLIKRECFPNNFCFKPLTTSTGYSFIISAAGTYHINWGDGTWQDIIKTDTVATTYSHTYSRAANLYEISLSGKASAYSTSESTAAITFNDNNMRVREIRGCLGCIFSTIDDELVPSNQRQPRFFLTFRANTLNTGIPDNLFYGLHGAPVSAMFRGLFWDANVNGSIPENLFAEIEGAPTPDLFNNTFDGSKVSGPLPETLFAGIKGPPAPRMFRTTFWNLPNLTGSPEKLFAGIDATKPSQASMFNATFYNCKSLTGYSPKIGGKYLYDIWSNGGGDTYLSAGKLSDYYCIPTNWGGAGTKAPGECEPAVEEDDD